MVNRLTLCDKRGAEAVLWLCYHHNYEFDYLLEINLEKGKETIVGNEKT